MPTHPARAVQAGDLGALQAVVGATGLFPPALLEGMLAGYLSGAAPQEIWLLHDTPSPTALAYCAPERMTEGTWNLLLIAVDPAHHRRGHGAALLRQVEADVTARAGRLLLVETSGLPEFDGPRAFYRRSGYREEARIRDFYQAGEDKVVFSKPLSSSARSAA